MRFVTKTIHAYLDYPVAIALIGLPLPAGSGQFQCAGVVHLAGRWRGGVPADRVHRSSSRGRPRSALQVSLAVDLTVGVLFLALPFALGFSGLDAAFYWINGAAVVAVIGLSKPETATAMA